MIVPGGRVGGIAQDAAALDADDGITALERRERADGVQGAHQRQQPFPGAARLFESRRMQSGGQGAVACRGVAHARDRARLP